MADIGSKTLSILAPAKINLFLHVTGRRDDGYHTLDSLFAFADCGDMVRLRPAHDLSFSADGPFARAFKAAELDASERSGNLAVRAARALARAVNRTPGVDIRLTKNLPLAAGIGGGSADAAAVLWGLMDMWNLSPAAVPGFKDLALALGADVPACLACQPVRVTGIGEYTAPVDGLDELPVLLVNPGRPCPTPQVFAAYKGPYSVSADSYIDDDLPQWLKARRNDLTAAAVAIVPEIGIVLDLLAQQKGCVFSRMSGSGATCFGIFRSEIDSLDAAEKLARAHPQWWIRAAVLNRAGRY